MLTSAVVVIAILLLAVIGLLLWLLISNFQSRRDAAGSTAVISMLQQQLELFRNAQESIRETLASSLQNGQQNISQTLQQHHQTLSQLNRQIGELHGHSSQLVNLQSDVRRLHDVLNSPKLRGQLGEWSLENLLAGVLPKDTYALQHHFKDGKIVDALIQMPEFAVPIDAKFPLSSFEAILKRADDGELPRLQRQFQKDVTAHIDKIAQSYIRPAEGTLDFAMMYIPAENVYYETIIKHDSGTESLVDYALSKKVIPVSPNVLYAYLMTIAMGLHGLQIEKQAAQIRQNLKRLESSFNTFTADFKTLGTHIRNTVNKYDEADTKLTRFDSQLGQITVEENSKQLQNINNNLQ
jgi:DNA recombination protein RmuC